MTKERSRSAGSRKDRITIERTYEAPIEDIWSLWTTKEGIESWWGPEGFSVVVRKIDLRPGGEQLYTMSATAPETVAFMKKAGMPLSTDARITYTEIVRHRRLGYTHAADFIPGVESYDVATVVELFPTTGGVRMVLTLDPMHDEQWTHRAVMGWESQLEKLAKVLERAGATAKNRA